MRHLFCTEGERALEAVMRRRPLLAFDFDGTLAPIVARPEHASVPAAVAQGLSRLAERLPVAVITGRAVADVRQRLGFEPRYVVGNHGAEDPAAEPSTVASQALDMLRVRMKAHADALSRVGVEVEDKRYSLALHYRGAQDPAAALACIDGLLRGNEPALKRFGGKCVVNVLAAGLPDKGDALAGLVRRCDAAAAVFVGDDVNDEAVFARAPAHWLTVRIGRDDPQSKAMFFLDRDAELALLLDKLLKLSDELVASHPHEAADRS